MKNGQIWVSAAIYFGLGVVVITLILTAGMPVINQLRDKNTGIQTKNLLFVLDNKVREVIRGGTGEQRYVEVEIKKGEFVIDDTNDKIYWSSDSRIQNSEVGIPIEEGNIIVLTENSNIEGEYKVTLSLDYFKIADLEYDSPSQKIIGLNQLIIKNTGEIVKRDVDGDGNLEKVLKIKISKV